MRIVVEGKQHYRKEGKLKCTACGCVFEYKEPDIRYDLNGWASANYIYVVCPNKHCQTDLLIKDYRSFLFRLFSGIKRPKFIQ